MGIIAVLVFVGIFAIIALPLLAAAPSSSSKQALAALDAVLKTEPSQMLRQQSMSVRKDEKLSSIPWLNKKLLQFDVASRLRRATGDGARCQSADHGRPGQQRGRDSRMRYEDQAGSADDGGDEPGQLQRRDRLDGESLPSGRRRVEGQCGGPGTQRLLSIRGTPARNEHISGHCAHTSQHYRVLPQARDRRQRCRASSLQGRRYAGPPSDPGRDAGQHPMACVRAADVDADEISRQQARCPPEPASQLGCWAVHRHGAAGAAIAGVCEAAFNASSCSALRYSSHFCAACRDVSPERPSASAAAPISPSCALRIT